MTESNQHQNSNLDEFIDCQMKIFENKIFPIHKLNFMQYLPLYIISLSSLNDKCTIFGEKFLTFLVQKSFNYLNNEHLSVRQQSWNYLSSLLSRQNSIIKDTTMLKSLQVVMNRFHETTKLRSNKLRKQSSVMS